MNWTYWRWVPWIDTRAKFVAGIPRNGKLLDLGSSDGGTLSHFAELRPDISFYSADLAGSPSNYPKGTEFRRADFEKDPLPWPNGMFDAVTFMHVIEHLHGSAHILSEAARVLKPGGSIYIETPHPKSLDTPSAHGAAVGKITMNFFDDPTHITPIPIDQLTSQARDAGLKPVRSGTSRNLLFTAIYPLMAAARLTTRKRFIAQLHWMGWSSYVIAYR
jgi:SAM-dependent methyltransferase